MSSAHPVRSLRSLRSRSVPTPPTNTESEFLPKPPYVAHHQASRYRASMSEVRRWAICCSHHEARRDASVLNLKFSRLARGLEIYERALLSERLRSSAARSSRSFLENSRSRRSKAASSFLPSQESGHVVLLPVEQVPSSYPPSRAPAHPTQVLEPAKGSDRSKAS
jgi:hypothetical protein